MCFIAVTFFWVVCVYMYRWLKKIEKEINSIKSTVFSEKQTNNLIIQKLEKEFNSLKSTVHEETQVNNSIIEKLKIKVKKNDLMIERFEIEKQKNNLRIEELEIQVQKNSLVVESFKEAESLKFASPFEKRYKQVKDYRHKQF